MRSTLAAILRISQQRLILIREPLVSGFVFGKFGANLLSFSSFSAAYTNPNLTTWVDDFKQSWPKNSKADTC